jgi:hypothetical protein
MILNGFFIQWFDGVNVDYFSRNSLLLKASAATKASQTKCPVATIVTSDPSVKTIAFPITKVRQRA